MKNSKATPGSGRESDLAASLEEMEKMDVTLKMKINEEKRARLSRIQEEEECRDILSKLPCPKTPRKIKKNLEEFLRILNEAEGGDEDSFSGLKSNGKDDQGDKEEKDKANRTGLPFVERNILLAKCGRGTLSVTDEEKLRIEHLLVDVENFDSRAIAKASTSVDALNPCSDSKEGFYGVDSATQLILGRINEQLEGLRESRIETESLERKESEGDSECEEEVKQGCKRERKKKNKGGDRLEEINKLLHSMSSVSEEEILPLSVEEIRNLVRRCSGSPGRLESGSPESDGGCRQNPKPSREVIEELVSCAKLFKPKFKFRFNDV